MRKYPAVAALVFALVGLGCRPTLSNPAYPSVGATNQVEVLANGKAKVVDVLSINDFHAALVEETAGKDPHAPRNPGVGKLATAIFSKKAANPNTLLVSAGDNYQGSALSVKTQGKVVSEFLKLVGVSASAVGNHEFDWGSDLMDRWSKDGGFPFLAANIVDKATRKPVPFAKPYQIFSVGGHTLALVGVSTRDTLTVVKPEFIAPFDIDPPEAAVKRQVEALQQHEKPEVILVLAHVASFTVHPQTSGGPMQSELCSATDTGEAELDAICAVPGVDAVITGHSHRTVARRDHGVPIVQALQNGRGLAKLSIVFDEMGGFTITPSVDELYRNKATLAINADAQAILDRYQVKEGKQLKEPVATLTADLPHARNQHVTPMGKWVCDTMKTKYGVEVVLMHGGGMRKGFVAGPILEQDFWDLMPFDQNTVIFSISGAALKQAIASGIDSPRFGDGQWSGVRVVYDPSKTGAATIISLTLDNGTPIEDGQIVRCATNDFQFDGGDCYTMLKASAKEVTRTYQPVREMLIAAARAQRTIVPPSVAGLVTAQPSN